MTLIAAKWKVEDYHNMIAAGILDERKVELLKGEIVEMSPEGEAHAYCSHHVPNKIDSLRTNREKDSIMDKIERYRQFILVFLLATRYFLLVNLLTQTHAF